MADRVPLVLGASGYVEELQPGDVANSRRPHYWAESGVFAATTSTTFLQYLRLTTPSIPAGVYCVSWSALWSVGGNFSRGALRVQVDDTQEIVNPSATDGFSGEAHLYPGFVAPTGGVDHEVWLRAPASGFRNVTLAAGIHTVDLDYRGDSGGSMGLHHGALAVTRIGA